MIRYRLTPSAQRDLSSIWDYTEDRWDAEQAAKYIREIWAALELVADRPELGRSREELREGYRSYVAGSHIIFFRSRSSYIEVVRIFHGRMDLGRHL